NLARYLSWLGVIGTACGGLCSGVTFFLGAGMWSQNIGDAGVSIPWFIMPIFLIFQRFPKNNEA
ncbi:MAG: hypothetical protein ACKOHM_11415, partial [Spartobacteria bacterium]